MSAELLVISRLLTLTSTAMTIYEQIPEIDTLLKRVHAEGRTISRRNGRRWMLIWPPQKQPRRPRDQ